MYARWFDILVVMYQPVPHTGQRFDGGGEISVEHALFAQYTKDFGVSSRLLETELAIM